MKLSLKLTSLFLSLIMIIGTIASCAKTQNNESNSDSDSESVTDSSTLTDNSGTDNEDYGEDEDEAEDEEGVYNPSVDSSKFPANSFPIFDGSAYTIKIVTSDKAKTYERQVATTLRSALKKKTSAPISTSTDYLKTGETYDASTYEILVGETKHTESASIYNVTDYNNYGIKTIGKKIVLYFSSADEGKELVSIIIQALKSNDKKAVWLESSISASKTTAPQLSGIPKYPATSLSTVDCDDNTSMVVAKSTTIDKFNEYCATLVNAGYTEYSKRENVDGNYFRTYTKGATAITAYFSNGRRQARIIVGPIKDIPSKDKDTTPETTKPTLTFIGPSDSIGNSLSLIYELPNGKFLIIDGGVILADRIYKELRELKPNATRFTIAGWFVSHPHNDHQDGLEYMIEQHSHDVDIENIYFNYVTPSYYDNLTSPDHQDPSNKEGHRVIRLRELLAKKLTRSTKIVKPHTGQIYNFGSATVEIISTVEDYLPTKLDHVNTSSMIVKVTVGGTSTMVLADASKAMKNIVLQMYTTNLKSDMVTLAHHGVWVDTPEMYTKVGAKVLLWPSNKAAAKEFYHGTAPSNTSYSKPAIKEALKQATDVYLARGTDNKFDLPYKTVGNKQTFIDNVLNG